VRAAGRRQEMALMQQFILILKINNWFTGIKTPALDILGKIFCIN
jgi:hypothetical protein